MNNKPEFHVQCAVANYLTLRHPGVLWTANPQAGFKMTIGQAMMAQRMGYRKGTPDIMILEKRHHFAGLFLELKAKEGRVSEDQRKFLSALSDRGYATAVCFGYDQAVKTIDFYLGGGEGSGLQN
jgi:hypothetical protein